MRRAMVVVAALAALLLIALPVGAITWGEPDEGRHPNVGAMVIDHPDHGWWQVCTGTLIHPRVFLTAGHCTEGLDDGSVPVWVNFDEYALYEDTLLEVERVITHPEFGWGGNDPHDVGLLVLAGPVADVEAATLPEPGLLDQLKKDRVLRPGGPEGAEFTVVGYGGTLDWPPPDIYYEDVRQVAYSEYVALTKVWLHMSQNSLKDNGGTCFGDSGGPAFWVETDPETGNETETLVGVTSWGDAQCVATGFDYRIDIPQALDFINGVIDGLD